MATWRVNWAFWGTVRVVEPVGLRGRGRTVTVKGRVSVPRWAMYSVVPAVVVSTVMLFEVESSM